MGGSPACVSDVLLLRVELNQALCPDWSLFLDVFVLGGFCFWAGFDLLVMFWLGHCFASPPPPIPFVRRP